MPPLTPVEKNNDPRGYRDLAAQESLMNHCIELPAALPFPPLVMSKLVPPQAPAQQTLRHALLARMTSDSPHKLKLIHAPAGFGKTTLLLQYRDACQKQQRRTLSLRLDLSLIHI